MDGLEFYSVTAQIIPILFLLLVFEHRFFYIPGRPATRLDYVLAVGYLLLVGTAEATALEALHDGKPKGYHDDLIWAALIFLWAGIVVTALRGMMDQARTEHGA
jgi:hypothetical protein